MKKKRLLAIFTAFMLGTAIVTFAACTEEILDPDDPDTEQSDPDTDPDTDPDGTETGDEGGDSSYEEPTVVYGLPTASTGRYIKDSDILEDDTTRWLVYTTNETSGEEDDVIAVRKGTYESGEDKGWTYGSESIAITGTFGAWDEYIGSASITKGTFNLSGTSYSWLMAYCATKKSNGTQYQIGLAVAQSPDGTWTKVGDEPIISFDIGLLDESASSVGCYAPSLINYDCASGIRLFFTYADSLGHFAKFVDINAADLGSIELSGQAFVTNSGNIDGGDSVNMFPNADFAYDSVNEVFYAVKDYSPTPSLKPSVSTRLQLLSLAEAELYTTDEGTGWVHIKRWDSTDTPDGDYERLYSACIVSDVYGHTDSAMGAEIVYNISLLKADTDDYLFTQNLMTFIVSY